MGKLTKMHTVSQMILLYTVSEWEHWVRTDLMKTAKRWRMMKTRTLTTPNTAKASKQPNDTQINRQHDAMHMVERGRRWPLVKDGRLIWCRLETAISMAKQGKWCCVELIIKIMRWDETPKKRVFACRPKSVMNVLGYIQDSEPVCRELLVLFPSNYTRLLRHACQYI